LNSRRKPQTSIGEDVAHARSAKPAARLPPHRIGRKAEIITARCIKSSQSDNIPWISSRNGRTSLDTSKTITFGLFASQPNHSRTSKANGRSTPPSQSTSCTDDSDNNAIRTPRRRTEASSLRHLRLPPNSLDLPRCHTLQAPRGRCHPSCEEV